MSEKPEFVNPTEVQNTPDYAFYSQDDPAYQNALAQCINGVPESAVIEPITGVPHPELRQVRGNNNVLGPYPQIILTFVTLFANERIRDDAVRTRYILGLLWLVTNHPSGQPYRQHDLGWLRDLQNALP